MYTKTVSPIIFKIFDKICSATLTLSFHHFDIDDFWQLGWLPVEKCRKSKKKKKKRQLACFHWSRL